MAASKRRAPGEGTIEPLPSGRFRVKLPTSLGKREPLGPFTTYEEADQARRGALKALEEDGRAGGVGITLYGYGLSRFDARDAAGDRSAAEDRRIWKRYLKDEAMASWPIANLRKRDIRRWRDKMCARKKKSGELLGRQTIVNALGVVRRVCADAVEDELMPDNPCLGVKIPERPGTEEPWTYLTPEEQDALVRAAGDEGLVALVAIGTGLRETEQWMLELSDVHVFCERPHLIARYGKRTGNQRTGKVKKWPTKNGQIRTVPLFGMALMALRKLLPTVPRDVHKNRFGLVFPGERGGYRPDKKAPKGFKSWLRKAGITRNVRWHDLRHTCASSLVAGWWGRAWSLEEVCRFLDHSSIKVTEKYAHLAPSVIDQAAAATHDAHLESLRSPRLERKRKDLQVN